MTRSRTDVPVRPATRLARVALSAIVLFGFATGDRRPPTGRCVSGTGAAAHLVAGSDGWETATPASMGMDATTLDQARAYAFTPDRHTQGVVVVRGGKIVDEWYAPGEGPDSWAASWSVGKSFASTLIGIAIAQGKIPSVDEPMTTYFPEWAGTPKAAITLRNVLHMESGLKWNEDYDVADVASSDVISMGLSTDELAYAASRPLANPPGTVFNYSSGDAMLLSGVIAKATGMPADAYARQVLYDPLGMQQVEWWRDAARTRSRTAAPTPRAATSPASGCCSCATATGTARRSCPPRGCTTSIQPTANSGGVYGYMWWIIVDARGAGADLLRHRVRRAVHLRDPEPRPGRGAQRRLREERVPAGGRPEPVRRLPAIGLVRRCRHAATCIVVDDDFLRPIVQSVVGPETGEPVVPGPQAQADHA